MAHQALRLRILVFRHRLSQQRRIVALGTQVGLVGRQQVRLLGLVGAVTEETRLGRHRRVHEPVLSWHRLVALHADVGILQRRTGLETQGLLRPSLVTRLALLVGVRLMNRDGRPGRLGRRPLLFLRDGHGFGIRVGDAVEENAHDAVAGLGTATHPPAGQPDDQNKRRESSGLPTPAAEQPNRLGRGSVAHVPGC